MNKSEIRELLGDRIKLSIKNKGITQRELAKIIGKHETEISRWCKGDGSPPYEILVKIVEATGCNPGWLLTGEGSMEPGDGEKKGLFDFRSPEKMAFDKNHQKFHTLLDNILDHGSTSQRREILGLIMDLYMQILKREEDVMKK